MNNEPTDISPPEDHEPIHLTESQVDLIVDRAVTKVFDRIYQDIGKGVVRKITWAIGLIATGLLIWLAGKGDLPK
jgi:tetrahydromethanopterin S-methyltransferase subunit G